MVLSLAGWSAIAAAAGASKKASLKITVPATPPQYKPITVTLSGQAGKYNAVAAYNYGSACPAKVPTTVNSKSVKQNKSFNVKLSFTSGNAGSHYACAYLYSKADPHGSDILKSKTFQTS